MDAITYQRFTDHLVAWAAGEPDVVALVAVGSTAAVTHEPDEWSDHDVLVVSSADASAGLLDDPSWLPDAERIVLWHTETVDGRAAVYDDDPTGTRRFRQIVVQLIIGLGRHARGESLSAHERIRGQALTHLLGLVRDFVPAESNTPLDNLDPYRRIELGHPAICRRLDTALTASLPELAETMLSLIQEHLADRVPAVSTDVLAAVRAVAARL